MPHSKKIYHSIKNIYKDLLNQHGVQNWWVKTHKFEIIVGAILVQNTNWKNADKALSNLKKNRLLKPIAILNISTIKLIQLIRPAGLYHAKAKYIKAFVKWYLKEGEYKSLKKLPTEILRKQLLSITGIGMETADVILLYVFNRPVFIIDKYTQNLLIKWGIIKDKLKYWELQKIFHEAIELNAKLYAEFHALIVYEGKSKLSK